MRDWIRNSSKRTIAVVKFIQGNNNTKKATRSVTERNGDKSHFNFVIVFDGKTMMVTVRLLLLLSLASF